MMRAESTTRRAPVHLLEPERLVARAERTLSALPRPFLRWAGSKQRLLRQLVPLLPPSYNTYFEPFVGAGSLFFLLQPTRAVLGDTCSELIETYRAVASDSDGVKHLSDLNPLDRTQYYLVRTDRATAPIPRAAEFIYLNRAGWNGLYRVNSRGEFNVPYSVLRSPLTSLLPIICAAAQASLGRQASNSIVMTSTPCSRGANLATSYSSILPTSQATTITASSTTTSAYSPGRSSAPSGNGTCPR